MRFRGHARCTSATSRSRSAIVIVVQCEQPPEDGVSVRGRVGYGWCAYASSRAWAAFIPRRNATGESPPTFPRGAVTPPATLFARERALSEAYAGLSSRVTYVRGETGLSHRRWFASFQTVHSWIHGYRAEAAYAKLAKSVPRVGATCQARPPFAQRGVPSSVRTTPTRRAWRPRSTRSGTSQS